MNDPRIQSKIELIHRFSNRSPPPGANRILGNHVLLANEYRDLAILERLDVVDKGIYCEHLRLAVSEYVKAIDYIDAVVGDKEIDHVNALSVVNAGSSLNWGLIAAAMSQNEPLEKICCGIERWLGFNFEYAFYCNEVDVSASKLFSQIARGRNHHPFHPNGDEAGFPFRRALLETISAISRKDKNGTCEGILSVLSTHKIADNMEVVGFERMWCLPAIGLAALGIKEVGLSLESVSNVPGMDLLHR
jgi:hypothetical protein